MKSPYLLASVTGLLIGTSYIPFPPWAIFFCFLPLWLTWLRASRWQEVFWTGWLSQFVLTLIGFNWVSYTVHEFGHLPWPAALAALLAFASICTLSIPLAGVVWFFYARRLQLKTEAAIVAMVALMCVGERVFPMIFDWHFGYTWLWAGFPAFHLADLLGFIGLSNLGLVFNGLFLMAWLRRQQGRAWWPWALAPVAAFLILNLAGAWHSRSLAKPDASASFLVVQANIGNEEKLFAEQGENFRDTVVSRFFSLTEQGVREKRPIDFAVWPETAFPDFIDDPSLSFGYPSRLREMVQRLGVPLITGGYSHMPGTRQATNSFFVLNAQGEQITRPYHKTILLAFGEYFPGANLWPRVREWFPEVADFARGPGPTVLNTGTLLVGSQICYEGLFDWFARQQSLLGAQVLVNLTNDSWYGAWQEPYQHLYMTLARAVEVRRPLVRSTNTGISTAILASGQILELSPVHQEWQHTYEIPYLKSPPVTVFMTWGFYLFPILLMATLAGLPMLAFRRKKL